MSAPFVGKHVSVVGTSRDDLNGSKGIALDFDREKSRYNVRLEKSGQILALKPANLQQIDGGSPPRDSGTSSAESAGASSLAGSNWTTVALVVFVGLWLYQVLTQSSGSAGGPSLWGSDGEDAEYDDRDEGYLKGVVREVTTLEQLKGALGHHSESTGLPVIVDFFSHSCGPCRMIAPAFKKVASDLKGKAVFLKVDVNRNYEASSACHVRAMPTFQFYLNKKKIHEFSGADERSLRRYTTQIVEQSLDEGTYVDQEVTREALQVFYETHDSSKLSEVPNLAEKYAKKTAQLVRVCQQKYGKRPSVTPLAASRDAANKPSASRSLPRNAKSKTLAELSADDLQAELKQFREELRRRGLEEHSPENEEDDEEDGVTFLEPDALSREGVQSMVIVGGGPAALAAGIYAARAGLRPVLLAPAFGGQLLGKGVDVENYPGVVGEHATGRGIVRLMRRQSFSFEARFVNTLVLAVDFSKRPFRLQLNGTSREVEARTVILASGAESRWLQVEGEQDLRGQGISACATCDGFLFRGKDVVVIGGGDHAMEDALHLARTCRSVEVIHRRDRFRASKILADKVLNHANMRVRWNTTVTAFHGSGDGLTHVTVNTGGDVKQIRVSGAFVAVGHDPQTRFLGDKLELDDAGYVTLRPGSTATSVPGVFAAGDVADRHYRQAVTASGTGAMAALDAERFLMQEGS